MYSLGTVVILIRERNKLLLAMKKRGFGEGKWNGPGGKCEPGEAPLQTAMRECQEEVGVVPVGLEQVAALHFTMNSLQESIKSTVYMCNAYKGILRETDEMRPQWFDIADIPYDNMWQDDIYWMPAVLAGRKVSGSFTFDASDTLVESVLKEVESF